jgi:hypothetical protein
MYCSMLMGRVFCNSAIGSPPTGPGSRSPRSWTAPTSPSRRLALVKPDWRVELGQSLVEGV